MKRQTGYMGVNLNKLCCRELFPSKVGAGSQGSCRLGVAITMRQGDGTTDRGQWVDRGPRANPSLMADCALCARNGS